MKSYIVKENHIGSAVSEMDPLVLQTDTQIYANLMKICNVRLRKDFS